jgi:hypothetical protein
LEGQPHLGQTRRHNAHHDNMVSANLLQHTPVTEIRSLARTVAYLTRRGANATQAELDAYET